ncbi:tetraacyldisaccharide 4'-kinase [Bosea caraganae]|uniref:Tetraacyldisaccharide 4'-kinase n=1 Tax=Bosea caraganae TaxID=2763117 RepID=A0A370L4N9_9HYPH|nr:tetraacyldisaccharide 4'-kinase [Bosea caraganae]RDJ23665.1 tetraacyldisaccharide 4'-kinase [Bosea caraganae]RDJ24481.1 tetraacyldisaccharide 4'-kinase [Bosea caraganae]
MRAPGFWWQRRPSLLARLLQPLGMLYGAVALGRMRGEGADAGIPVICVGNFIAGGAGKTPTAMALARLALARGETPFVLMRGYGGRLAGPVEVDPRHHDAAGVGDEAMLMAATVRTIVARDRPAGAAFAKGLGASLIIMDDGLQNPSLAKRLRLAVVDGAAGIGNGLCLPAGPLRAPLDGQLGQTDAVIVIGKGEAGDAVAKMAQAAGKPVLLARLKPAAAIAAQLKGRAVLALSGIGRPEKFAATLREAGATIAAERAYGDHHAYAADDVAEILAEAIKRNCLVATTEKDMVKLEPLWPAAERRRLIVVPVTLDFEAPERIAALLDSARRGRSEAV